MTQSDLSPQQRASGCGCAVVIALIIGAAVVSFLSRESDGTTASPAPVAASSGPVVSDAQKDQTKRLIAEAVEAHVVKRVDVANHEAQVYTAAWLAFDADGKRNLVVQLAHYCNYAGTFHEAEYVKVVDAQSGLELASYDPFGVHIK